LGLERYEPLFRDNEIDWEVLPKLTSDDLRDIGVAAVGHRRKLMDAIGALGASAPTAVVAAAVPGASAPAGAERRQLTVMFCDLVGSTPLSARHDPEDLRGIMGSYHRCVAETVQSFGGFVARYMGDGALIYFGYPQAHEDDAERAIRCGLTMVDRVQRLKLTEELHTRVGIATGLVVVGGEVVEHDIVGETPNLAARLQALAAPDTVVVALSTRRLVGDLFEYHDLGAAELKGIAEPVPAWLVWRPSAVASRFEALRGSALTPLIGRGEEIGLLLRRWARAKAGDGQVVLLTGEPGIGKSRLAVALSQCLAAESHIRLNYFCSPYYQDSALYPFVDQLARASGFVPDDPPTARLKKLETLLTRAAPPDEDVALIVDLLSLPASDRYPLPNLSPQRKKERTLEALIRQLEGLVHEQPVLMVFEDAHWVDPTSRELLDLAIERVRNLPVLVIVTFRPELKPLWTGQPQVTMLALNRLDQRDRTALVAQIAGGNALPDEIVNQIADRTDGVPLFIEELTKSMLESGVPLVGIPTTLHDSLMARLDRLASVRLVAQIGAAIGRQFPYVLLRAVSRLSEDELRAALARLVASELVFQRGTPPGALYTFKHALVQDAAHESLLRSTRQQLHAQIADALETHFPELMDTQPELFAQHYAEAGLVEKSTDCWGRAGHRSASRSAVAEAASQFQKALDQLALLPDNYERQRHELELRSALGAVLMLVQGFAASEPGDAYARARDLWEQLGCPSEFHQVPYGQSRYYLNRGELDLAQRSAEVLLSLSRKREDPGGIVLGNHSLGRTLFVAGRFALSRSHFEEGCAVYDPIFHRPLVDQAGVHPRAMSQGELGIVLFCLGFPEQGLTCTKAAIAEVRELAHPPSVAVTSASGTILFSLAGDDVALRQAVDEIAAVATEHGFPLWGAWGTIYQGLLTVKTAGAPKGILELRKGLTAYQASGADTWMPYFLSLLAKACETTGESEEASSILTDAFQIVERTGERWFTAELNRHKGGLFLRQGNCQAAERHYRKALSIALKQEAKLWELRASVSLARLWAAQGRLTEAHDLLAPVYGWFTEGFDTADLKDARILLDELA
jgi:class 3 adenylate cyclase/predicted ATPase